jgi:hydrogenase maturation protein HypF
MAIREPWRLAVVWLYRLYKNRIFNIGLEVIKKIDRKKWQVIKNMYLTDFNAPLASSAGRLFDAAASLILAEDKARFEGELAIKLEKIAQGCKLAASEYPVEIIKEKNMYVINPLPMFRGIVWDLKRKREKRIIAYRFHLTLARMIEKICLILRRETRINKVILSGGVFQNKLLLGLAFGLLCKRGFVVYSHKSLSSNDANISLGQVAIANFRS